MLARKEARGGGERRRQEEEARGGGGGREESERTDIDLTDSKYCIRLLACALATSTSPVPAAES